MDILHPFHAFPVHLFHESKPPIVANDAETESKARADGYGETYVHQDYPKHVNHEDGSVTVLSAPPEE